MPSLSLLPGGGGGGGSLSLLPGGSGGGGTLSLLPGGGGSSGTISLLPAGSGGSGGGIFPSATPGITQATQPSGITYSNTGYVGYDPFGIGSNVDLAFQQSGIRYLSDNWLDNLLGQLLDEPQPETGYKQLLLLAALLIGTKALLK